MTATWMLVIAESPLLAVIRIHETRGSAERTTR